VMHSALHCTALHCTMHHKHCTEEALPLRDRRDRFQSLLRFDGTSRSLSLLNHHFAVQTSTLRAATRDEISHASQWLHCTAAILVSASIAST
jgi:hypothetical protein